MNIKYDCFAYKGNKCIATENKNCKCCPFYKTEEQFKADFLKGKQILSKHVGLENAQNTYPLFNEMCKKIR